jgi:hypothetical protein
LTILSTAQKKIQRLSTSQKEILQLSIYRQKSTVDFSAWQALQHTAAWPHITAHCRNCRTLPPVPGAAVVVDSRLLTINRLLQDFFLLSKSTIVGFFFSSRQYGQLLKP